jgi:hypothetical protein
MVLIMDEPDSRFMDYVVRMVIPMKREFGRALDVPQFLNNRPYAIEVIEQALQSKDERLREYAAYLEGKLFGPRNSSSAGVRTPDAGAAPAATPAPASPQAAPAQASESSHAELRARMLAKYKSGLR